MRVYVPLWSCSPNDAEVEEAARAANAHEFIKDLPEGYTTVITGGCASWCPAILHWRLTMLLNREYCRHVCAWQADTALCLFGI